MVFGKFLRDRTDKLTPNIDWVAERADKEANNPVTKKDLENYLKKSSSSSVQHSSYDARAYNSFSQKRKPERPPTRRYDKK